MNLSTPDPQASDGARGNVFRAQSTVRAGVLRVDAYLQDFSFPAHSHEHVCIGLMHRGEYSSRYGLRRHCPQPGDVIFVNPGDLHDGRPSGRHGRVYSMLEVDPAAYAVLCHDAIGMGWIDFPQAVLSDHASSAALADWLAALHDAPPEVEREKALLLLGGAADQVRAPAPSRRACSALALEVRKLLQEEGAADAIGVIATRVGCSRYQAIRAFKSAYEQTPEDFRRQWRVRQSRAWLAGADSLATIAARAGFADQSHMNREFRRYTGLTPGAYRRALS
jgi:AraC-like DNA-binding protein